MSKKRGMQEIRKTLKEKEEWEKNVYRRKINALSYYLKQKKQRVAEGDLHCQILNWGPEQENIKHDTENELIFNSLRD